MHIGTAQVFGADHLSGRGFDQRRPGEKNGGLLAHHDRFVRHRGHVRAARGARAHDHGDLGNPGGAHVGLIEEDAPKVLAVREDFVLTRQVGAARIHQVNARQPVLLGNGLRPQVLFDRQRVVRAAFDRGVVGHNHAFHAFNPTDPGNDAGSRDVLAVHLVSRQLTQFKEGRANVQQPVDAFTRQQLAPGGVALLGAGAAALLHMGEHAVQGVHLFEHGVAIGGELGGARVDGAVQDRHGPLLSGFR